MKLSPLSVACPACGSKEVIYSCEPACCFNHVCSNCLASFELATRDLEESFDRVEVGNEERDSCAPTVACARCKSLGVFQTDESPARLACTGCRALLELELSFDTASD